MLGWLNRQVDCFGSVLFRGSIPPLLSNFTQLEPAGVSIRNLEAGPNAHWRAELTHREWGEAEICCFREFVPVAPVVVKFDSRLSDEDKQAATLARSGVSLKMQGHRKNVLRDRKQLLRYFQCLMGDDALISMDHMGQKLWTRESLDEELLHDADLDIESMFVIHCVHEEQAEGVEEKPVAYWAHTHGLAELGVYDFDVLRPSPLLMGAGSDTFRAIAYMILEGQVGPSTDRHPVVQPGGEVAFVDVAEFNRKAAKADLALRDDPNDPAHNQKRLILCEPAPRGLMAWLRGRNPRPSVTLSTIDDDNMISLFTTGASDLMAARARNTIELFRQFSQEFAELEVKPLVKLGYRVDGGEPNDREHLWFEVHSCNADSVDATLLNQPYYIARMKANERGQHDLGLLTDWTIITPAGSINPREMGRARFLRSNRERVLEILRQAREAGQE